MLNGAVRKVEEIANQLRTGALFFTGLRFREDIGGTDMELRMAVAQRFVFLQMREFLAGAVNPFAQRAGVVLADFIRVEILLAAAGDGITQLLFPGLMRFDDGVEIDIAGVAHSG